MTNLQTSHVKFDGKRIEISPDLKGVFLFLAGIDEEIESLMNFEKKLNTINDGYRDILDVVIHLSDKLKDNKIDFEYKMPKDDLLSTVEELKNFHPLVRSQCIVLFSNIEVLLCLHIAYNQKIYKKEEIKKYSMSNEKFVKKFIRSYFLTEKNIYFKQHQKRFSKISAKDFKNFRNSLIHFFSLDRNISVVPHNLSKKARKVEQLLEKKGRRNIIFISPEDLHQLIREAFIILIKKWNDDSLQDRNKFLKNILPVKKIIAQNGAVIIPDRQINI